MIDLELEKQQFVKVMCHTTYRDFIEGYMYTAFTEINTFSSNRLWVNRDSHSGIRFVLNKDQMVGNLKSYTDYFYDVNMKYREDIIDEILSEKF